MLDRCTACMSKQGSCWRQRNKIFSLNPHPIKFRTASVFSLALSCGDAMPTQDVDGNGVYGGLHGFLSLTTWHQLHL